MKQKNYLVCIIMYNYDYIIIILFLIPTENFPPNISADAVFRVTLGMESIYILTVMDPGDNVTLSVRGGLPVNSVLEKVDEEEYIFIWTLMELTNEPLVFIANDSRGAASTFSPVVEVCACVNGGACTHYQQCNNHTKMHVHRR